MRQASLPIPLLPIALGVSLAAFACGDTESLAPPTASETARLAGHPQGDSFVDYGENQFVDTSDAPSSTFSVDVDTASYSIMRRDLRLGSLPRPASVRPEEFINYFKYEYKDPGNNAFSINIEGAPSRFGEGLSLLRIGVRGRTVPEADRRAANLVFLVDVSGSMRTTNKLGLVKYSLKQLVDKLGPQDTLGIVVYAAREGLVLEPTPVERKSEILDAIDGLSAGGSTAGEAGIRLAYDLAEAAFRPEGINRVVLCSDGDFNVGATGRELISLIEDFRQRGISLTTLGFGAGNYNDADMEQLADRGDGNYAYIDSPNEALRVLGDNLVSTLQVIAKDAKIQVRFDPMQVERYRLIGYENRRLRDEDFANDAVDAGDIGAGHDVTALYEIELVENEHNGPLATVKLRHKAPHEEVSVEEEHPFERSMLRHSFLDASDDLRLAAAVAEFAEILRGSVHSHGQRFDEVLQVAEGALGSHPSPSRLELSALIGAAKSLQSHSAP